MHKLLLQITKKPAKNQFGSETPLTRNHLFILEFVAACFAASLSPMVQLDVVYTHVTYQQSNNNSFSSFPGLCQRRNWSAPLYSTYPCSAGYTCIVQVNNREYQTDGICTTDTLARENAAMRAYLICRNFSVNDGMYPAGHNHGGVVQGIPVAIGTGRRSRYSDESDGSASMGSRSGGSSPESFEGHGARIERERALCSRPPARALAYQARARHF